MDSKVGQSTWIFDRIEYFDCVLTTFLDCRCQSYEGGFSACPGMEAHGGYSFCGLATLFMLGKDHLCDINAFTVIISIECTYRTGLNGGSVILISAFHFHWQRWIVNRQMRLEGGFQGRTNKLVDACYSFWQGGAFLFLHNILFRESKLKVIFT